ncbi:MAG: hypothetical protein COB23_03195 [Methylophaga sp.]|nr:MAG: hypothetical protein COB23_03195 [Methylophaga sp.]
MREADIVEVMASSAELPFNALDSSVRRSTHVWTATVDGRACLIFGVVPFSILGGMGIPWLLGTDEIALISRPFIKECKNYVGKMNKAYPSLANAVHAENQLSIRWLKWLGFSIHPAQKIGLNGELFHPFEKRLK